MITKWFFILGLMLLLIGCTPPTPPPSPTPRPSATPSPVQTTPTARAQRAAATATFSPQPQATAPATPTRSPLLPTDTPAVTTISLWVDLPEPQLQQLANDIDAFQAEFPYYAVSLQSYDGAENFMPALASGDIGFDLLLASPILLGSLKQNEQLAPMSDFFSPSFLDNFAAVTLMGAAQDGEVWGVPQTAGFHLLLFYNRELVDSPPDTTEELLALAEPLTSGSTWGLGVNSYDPLWLAPWLAPYGSWLTDSQGQPTLDTAAMEKAVSLFLSWHDPESGIAPAETYDEVRKKFLSGDMAMMIDGEWAIGELATVRDLNWGVARLPQVADAEESQQPAPLVLAKYWAVSRDVSGEQALAASTFLEFITRSDQQLAWTARFWTLPTRRTALDAPLIVNDSLRRISAAQMQAGRPLPLGTNANALLDAMRDPLRRAIEGDLSPAEVGPLMQANLEP